MSEVANIIKSIAGPCSGLSFREQIELTCERMLDNTTAEDITSLIDVSQQIFGGMYLRQNRLKKGAFVIGVEYKVPNLFLLLEGKLALMNDDFCTEVEAPATIFGRPFTKRAGYAIEDSTVLVVTPTTKETFIEAMEETMVELPTVLE